MDAAALAVDALTEVGLKPRLSNGSTQNVDLALNVDGTQIVVELKSRSLVDEDTARRLTDELQPPDAILLVVANRVTDAARRMLTARRGGYLDLRGRLALRAEGVVIDVDVDPIKLRAARTSGLSGRAGLEVGTALLMRPERAPAVRNLARELGRSPSTVSEVLAALVRGGLINEDRTITGSDLFWQVADRWPTRRVRLAAGPTAGDSRIAKALRLGLTNVEHETGWALTDSAAAVAYGAPLVSRSTEALDFFVPDEAVLRRAATLLHTDESAVRAGSTVRVAPVPAVVQQRVDRKERGVDWPLAHPLFVALDLAQDQGRGRQILDAWVPDEPWTRVW